MDFHTLKNLYPFVYYEDGKRHLDISNILNSAHQHIHETVELMSFVSLSISQNLV